MTHDDLLALPPTFDIVTAGRALGMSRSKSYQLAQTGEFPIRVLRLGHAYRVTRADLLRFLGETDESADAAPQGAA